MSAKTIARTDLRRPDDFVKAATAAGAEHDHTNGRHVVRKGNRTIGFSDHGNKEFTTQYRRLLIKAFTAAGFLALLLLYIVNAIRPT